MQSADETCEDSEQQKQKRRRANEGFQHREEEKKEEEETIDPFNPLVAGGGGPARGCRWNGSTVPFHDGGRLLSPRRCDFEKRCYAKGSGWEELRMRLRELVVKRAGSESALERECFLMARGESGCKLVQDEDLLHEVRRALSDFCCLGEAGLEVAEGQQLLSNRPGVGVAFLGAVVPVVGCRQGPEGRSHGLLGSPRNPRLRMRSGGHRE